MLDKIIKTPTKAYILNCNEDLDDGWYHFYGIVYQNRFLGDKQICNVYFDRELKDYKVDYAPDIDQKLKDDPAIQSEIQIIIADLKVRGAVFDDNFQRIY
jgi:hypothetical protein